MSTLRALLLSTLLLSCSTPDPLDYCAPPCTPQGDIAMVCLDSALPDTAREGVRRWARVLCDRRFAMQIIDGEAIPVDCQYTILMALSEWPWVQAAPPGTAAFSDPSRGIAWIITDVCPAALVTAATAHELGALLGATDDLGPGVMGEPLVDTCIGQHSVDEVLAKKD